MTTPKTEKSSCDIFEHSLSLNFLSDPILHNKNTQLKGNVNIQTRNAFAFVQSPSSKGSRNLSMGLKGSAGSRKEFRSSDRIQKVLPSFQAYRHSILKLHHKNPNNLYDSLIKNNPKNKSTLYSSMDNLLKIRNLGCRNKDELSKITAGEYNLGQKEREVDSPIIDIRKKMKIENKQSFKAKKFNLSVSNFGSYVNHNVESQEGNMSPFNKLRNKYLRKHTMSQSMIKKSSMQNSDSKQFIVFDNLKQGEKSCPKKFNSSMNSRILKSQIHESSPNESVPEGTTNDALMLMHRKRRYLDKLPLNEEDKMAILKHHLKKKDIKNSRVKKAIFKKRPSKIICQPVKSFDFNKDSPLPENLLLKCSSASISKIQFCKMRNKRLKLPASISSQLTHLDLTNPLPFSFKKR